MFHMGPLQVDTEGATGRFGIWLIRYSTSSFSNPNNEQWKRKAKLENMVPRLTSHSLGQSGTRVLFGMYVWLR